MAFYQKTGKRQGEAQTVPASTIVTAGAVMRWDGNGNVLPATTTSSHHAMLAGKNKKVADSDYATATEMTGAMLTPDAEFECDSVSGTATVGMVGKSYDLLDSVSVNVSAQVQRVFTITKFISASKVWGRFNSSYQVTGGFGNNP